MSDSTDNKGKNQREVAFSWATADRVQYDLANQSARRMRRQPTLAEEVLWQHLRGSQLGMRFRRQHVIDRFIADFICLPAKIVVEVDGGYHHEPEQQEHDENRTQYLNSIGYKVLRFTNEEVLHQTTAVLSTLRRHMP